jgi:uncharacterized protein YlxW (UPF0749 family)
MNEPVSNNSNNGVTLGCGSLILIALIVMFFSGGSAKEVGEEVKKLRTEIQTLQSDVKTLQKSVDDPSAKLKNPTP